MVGPSPGPSTSQLAQLPRTQRAANSTARPLEVDSKSGADSGHDTYRTVVVYHRQSSVLHHNSRTNIALWWSLLCGMSSSKNHITAGSQKIGSKPNTCERALWTENSPKEPHPGTVTINNNSNPGEFFACVPDFGDSNSYQNVLLNTQREVIDPSILAQEPAAYRHHDNKSCICCIARMPFAASHYYRPRSECITGRSEQTGEGHFEPLRSPRWKCPWTSLWTAIFRSLCNRRGP